MEKKKEKTLGIIHMDEGEDSQINRIDQIFNKIIEGKCIQIMERQIYGKKLWKHTHTYMKHTEYQIDKTRNKIPNGVS